jgi:hypothetical protein
VNALKRRGDVTLIEVTPANRQAMPDRVLCWLQSRVSLA